MAQLQTYEVKPTDMPHGGVIIESVSRKEKRLYHFEKSTDKTQVRQSFPARVPLTARRGKVIINSCALNITLPFALTSPHFLSRTSVCVCVGPI